MIVISCKNIKKSFGINTVLEDISFNINKGDRVGLVGINGAGKSTLMEILSGEKGFDQGELIFGKDIRIGYLKQNQRDIENLTVLEAGELVFAHLKEKEKQIESFEEKLRILEKSGDMEAIEKASASLAHLLEDFQHAGGYTFKSRTSTMLSNVGFSPDYWQKQVSSLSGGEKTRLALACLLLDEPDVLLLDEPTNHLDIGTIKWLEQYLVGYKGSLMVISHDRYFLNKLTNRTIEIEAGRSISYSGGYDFYAEEKRKNREVELKAYEKQSKEIKRQEDLIRKFKERGTEKLAKRALSREKALEKIERIEAPKHEQLKMKLRFKEEYKSGNDVLKSENLSKSFGYGSHKKTLFSNVNLDIKRGEKICIVGENGVGKTTLLRMIKGDFSQNEGYIKLGHNVKIAYYDQNQELLNDNLSVIEELHNSLRLYSQGELRGLLGMFMFKGDRVEAPIRSLSGGERARLSLLKLMMEGANLLILDEPTNHLDIQAKEVFEQAVMSFEGTVIMISHDRYLLSKVPDKILELSVDGIKEYIGKYDYYEDKKASFGDNANVIARDLFSREENSNTIASSGVIDASNRSEAGLSSKDERQKKKEAEREEKRIAKEKANLEKEIEELEAKIQEEESLLLCDDVVKDYEKLAEISSNLESLKAVLQEKYEKWLQ